MARTSSKQRGTVDNVLLAFPIRDFGIVAVCLPALSLAFCFVTAFFFRHEDATETMCEVKNYIPSVSAVTGIFPQTYLWRTCIGLHSGMRYAVAFMYYNLHMSRINRIPVHRRSLYKLLTRVNFWANILEVSCLVLVAFISNRENYPIHEKIFVGFLVGSIAYLLFNTILFKWTQDEKMTYDEKRSFWWKKAMLVTNILSTSGLIYYFIQHRLYCIQGAFSMFSAYEYVIAYSNMFYHFTGILDFKGGHLLFGQIQMEESVTNGNASTAAPTNNNKLKQKDQ